MNQVKVSAAALIAAWGMLVDQPLPKWLVAPFKNMRIPTEKVLLAFPFAGVLIAAVPLIIGGVVSIIFNRMAGGLCFALLGGTVLLFKDSGRGIALLLSYAAKRISGTTASDALEECDHHIENVLRNPLLMFAAVILSVVLLCMLFALFFCGAGVWFASVLAADALVQGRLCLKNSRSTGVPFIFVPAERSYLLAVSGGIIAVLSLIIFPKIAALGAVVIVWVWFWRELPESDEFSRNLDADWITLCGFWAAVLMLLCGMGLL